MGFKYWLYADYQLIEFELNPVTFIASVVGLNH